MSGPARRGTPPRALPPGRGQRLRLTEVRDGLPSGEPVTVEAPPADAVAGGTTRVEVVVDGWRFEFDVDDADRAELRDRATRAASGPGAAGGPLEIRAIIPGRVAAVAVVDGDAVDAGQALLVVEAMKMQNELRAPRAGVVVRVGVGAGQTIEIGDLLVTLG